MANLPVRQCTGPVWLFYHRVTQPPYNNVQDRMEIVSPRSNDSGRECHYAYRVWWSMLQFIFCPIPPDTDKKPMGRMHLYVTLNLAHSYITGTILFLHMHPILSNHFMFKCRSIAFWINFSVVCCSTSSPDCSNSTDST